MQLNYTIEVFRKYLSMAFLAKAKKFWWLKHKKLIKKGKAANSTKPLFPSQKKRTMKPRLILF